MLWRSSYHKIMAQIADFSTTIISFVISYYITRYLHRLNFAFFPAETEINRNYITLVILVSIIYVTLFKQQKAYSFQRFTSLSHEYWIIFKVSLIGALICIAYLFLFKMQDVSRTIVIAFTIISFLLFIVEKTALFLLASFIRQQGKNRKKIILVGTGPRTKNFINIVKSNFNWGLDIVGILTADVYKIGKEINGIQIIGYYKDLQTVLKKVNPDEIIITISTKKFNQIREVMEICENEGVVVRINSDFLGHITKDISVDSVFGLNIISFNMVYQTEIQLFIKRIIDLIGATVALLIFAPFMLIAGIGIWLSDGAPIMYQWNVIGLNKKPFRSWKFRTMVRNADKLKKELLDQNEMDGPVFKIKNDPRIIPFGRLLRKLSIDETPQLFSVLKGDMSLVGPRPAGPHELERYESWHRRKLSIKPGITCLWQASGRNQINKFDDWVKLDLEYIDNWSLLLDIKILIRTVVSVVSGRGAS